MNKKVIYIEIDEEITSVYDRVKNLKAKELWLMVPKKAILFQSPVNLEILKSKLLELGKKLMIVTSDDRGRHLAEKVGIEVHHRIEVEEMKAPPEEDAHKSIAPIQARRNEITRDTPKRVVEKKISIRELIEEYRLKGRHIKKNLDHKMPFEIHPNRKFFASVLILAVGLFGLISYIALPGATLYIKPSFDTVTHTVNVTLADKRKNVNLLRENKPNVIASETISITTKQTRVFNTASKEFEGVNATGKIKIINTSEEPWELKGGTRFQAEGGLIFRVKESIVVPPATELILPDSSPNAPQKQNGELVVRVEADPFDIYGEPIGARGNIGITTFTLPGLSAYNQKQIWAESVESMTGGVTQYRPMIREQDIEAAKKQIEDNLVAMAREDLRARIEEMNELNHTRYVLLDDRRYLKTKLLELKMSEDLVGSSKEKFEVFAKISAEGVAYDSDMLFGFLKKEMLHRIHPDMRLVEESLKPESISYEIVEESEDTGQIKITATLSGIEEYVIEPTEAPGVRFGNKVKDKVKGLDKVEAAAIVTNLAEVEALEIKTWPFWIDKLPRIPENIAIKRMSEGQN